MDIQTKELTDTAIHEADHMVMLMLSGGDGFIEIWPGDVAGGEKAFAGRVCIVSPPDKLKRRAGP